MKIIQLHRHSTKQGPGNSNLSLEGVAFAKEVARTKLVNKQFTHLCVSPLQRTRETMEAFKEGAGDFPVVDFETLMFKSALTDAAMSLWNSVCHAAEMAGKDMLLAVLQEKKISRLVADEAAQEFRDWLNSLPENTHALVVNHSPFLELIVYSLFNVILPQLQPCDGFIIIEKDGELKLVNSV